jgi:glycosyltransferase involved in cell wall biosynthesis
MPDVFYNAMVLREPYSGVEVTVHQLACALATYGSLPLCACVPAVHRPIPAAPHVQIRPARLPASRLLRILWEQTVLPVLLRRSRAPLLHAPAYVAPLAAPCPTVLTVHDLHALTHPQFCSRENRLHYSLVMPPSIRRASAIIVFSPHVRRLVLERFPESRGRIAVIPPGLSPGLARCADAARLQAHRQRYALPASFILFVGDLTRRKNLLGLLSAFAAVREKRPGLHLVLAGAADPAAAAGIDREAGARGVRDRVCRAGYVAAEDLPALYSLAQAFVFPSHDEGFGLPPLEAMACGCPVVCSGGAPVENCGSAAVACDLCDPASITDAVSLLLDRPDIRQQKVDLGFSKAAEYSWKKAALATEAVYRAVLAQRPLSTDFSTP